jgi:hypothetical protein
VLSFVLWGLLAFARQPSANAIEATPAPSPPPAEVSGWAVAGTAWAVSRLRTPASPPIAACSSVVFVGPTVVDRSERRSAIPSRAAARLPDPTRGPPHS